MADLVRLSKFLAVMLRHEPEQFGLALDEEGFTDTDAVWAQVGRRYPGQYSYGDLLKVVEGDQDGKKRYEIHGRRIRALYGHSEPRVVYPPAVPPETLYHGTTREVLASIRQHGLQSRGRQYVHLTTTTHRATTVAGRHHGSPVMLVVRSGDAARAGVTFYHPEAEHYLAEAVPPAFIEFPENTD